MIGDSGTAEMWNYLTQTRHTPIEYLVMGTFFLVLLDRLEKVVDAWEAKKPTPDLIGPALTRIEDTVNYLADRRSVS